MPKATGISTFTFLPTHALFFDANIWLRLYWPRYIPSSPDIKAYADAQLRVMNAKAKVFIDVMVISEFVNRYAKLEQERSFNWKNKIPKDYRNSADFKPVANQIADMVKRIGRITTQTETQFCSMNLDSLMVEYEKGNADFNDQIYIELCKQKQFTFVTHDRDFRGAGIPMLSANPKLTT
jgi:predicted nucleic acid-binding protein